METNSKEYAELRLKVMMTIRHPESYYQHAAKSLGIDIAKMQHDEIATFIASLKATEADILIDTAFEADKYPSTDFVRFKLSNMIASANKLL